MRRQKKIQIGIVALLVIICIGYGVKYHHGSVQGVEPSVIVQAEKVKVGEIPIEVQVVGTLTADKNVDITPEFSGQIAVIYFHDGEFVKQGAPLIQLDDQVIKAKSESTKAALYYSQSNYKRMLLLGKQGAVSKQAIESAQADLKQKQADAQENQVAVDKMKLSAPFDGVLAKAKVSVGDHVTAGQALVNLTDIQHLRVEYNVSEKYLSQLKIGQQVKVTTNAYPDKVFAGVVAYIAPTINADDRTLALYAEINNIDRQLTAGLFVNGTQNLGVHHQVVIAPAQSVVPTIDGQKIYKIVNGKAVSASVIIGQRNSDTVQIEKGLEQGDVIVTAGQEKLKEGMSVIMNTNVKKS